MEELDAFENLTSRFARTSDIYTQKIMKGIILILREDARTFLDSANLFEKLNIADVEELKLIRDLRNEISHEYRLSDVSEIFEGVLEYSVKLLRIIDKTTANPALRKWISVTRVPPPRETPSSTTPGSNRIYCPLSATPPLQNRANFLWLCLN
jgi:hypothetical protein